MSDKVEELNAELDGVPVENESIGEQSASELTHSPEPEINPETAAMCTGIYAASMGLLAARLGGHWALSAVEAEQLGEATAPVMDKYFPDLKGGPEVVLLMALGVVIVPRYMIHGKIEREKAANPDKEKPLKEKGVNDDQ